jgi:hypothetical protein
LILFFAVKTGSSGPYVEGIAYRQLEIKTKSSREIVPFGRNMTGIDIMGADQKSSQ